MKDYASSLTEIREKEKRLKVIRLFQEVSKFKELQQKFAKFGAYDSEPCQVFRSFMIDFLKGKEGKVPTTASQWGLFTDMTGVGNVAKELTKQLGKVINVRVTMKEVVDVASWFGWNR